MPLDILDAKPVLGLEPEHRNNQVPALRRHTVIDTICPYFHLMLDLISRATYVIRTRTLKWRIAVQHLIQQYPQSPHIDPAIIGPLEYHLGGHILVGAAVSGVRIAGTVRRPAEIAQPDVVLPVQQQILWLGITEGTLMSRCMIDKLCRYLTAWRLW